MRNAASPPPRHDNSGRTPPRQAPQKAETAEKGKETETAQEANATATSTATPQIGRHTAWTTLAGADNSMRNPAACFPGCTIPESKQRGSAFPPKPAHKARQASLKASQAEPRGHGPMPYSAMSSLSPNGMLPMGSWRSMAVLNAMMVSLRERPRGWSLS